MDIKEKVKNSGIEAMEMKMQYEQMGIYKLLVKLPKIKTEKEFCIAKGVARRQIQFLNAELENSHFTGDKNE